MTNVDIVKVVKNVTIFEKGDLIMFTNKEADKNIYGVVVEDQDPNDIDTVRVRDITSGHIVKLVNIYDEDDNLTPCKFVMHLDKVDIDRT